LASATTAPSTVTIAIDYFSTEARAKSLVMPYFIHPDLWQFEREFPRMGKAARQIRLGFAGCSNADIYRREFAFPILSRSDIFQALERQFGEDVFVRDLNTLATARRRRQPMIFATTSVETDTTTKHLLQGGRYLRFLGDSDFVIAPPGCVMPFSHNLIEAMYLGAIPILNYPHYLQPPLRSDVDCLAFTTTEGLFEAVRRALTLEPAEIARLRAGVRHYVNEHLSPHAFGRRLKACLPGHPTVLVNDESNSVALWRHHPPPVRC
jgi:hypothetical protein